MATHKSTFGMVMSGFHALDGVNCTGNESYIVDCPHPPISDCSVGSEEAGVICGVTSGKGLLLLLVISSDFFSILISFNITGPSERCTEEHTNKTISIVGSNNITNLTAGR